MSTIPDYTPVTAPEIKFKTPDESIVYAAEFERQLEDGETLNSGADAEEILGDPAAITSTLVISEITISGTKVRFRVAGGTDGIDYEIMVTVLTANPANTRQLRCRLCVRAA